MISLYVMALYAFDGTRNHRHGTPDKWDPEDTNVVKFCDAYIGDKHYFDGVGSEPGNNAVMEILGSAFGAGGKTIIGTAYMRLAEQITRTRKVPKDLDVIGYSRGAALAIHFVNLIREKGVPDIKTKYKEKTSRMVYSGGRRRRKYTTVTKYKKYFKVPSARFLGLWDTVAAFGMPMDIGPIPTQKINMGYKLYRPTNTSTYHAMALDENRGAFQVTRLKGASETWFRGVHSNIGGNFEGDEGLSDIALMWMIAKAKDQGVQFDEDALETVAPNPKGKKRNQGRRASVREVKTKDRLHYSVGRKKYPKLKGRGLGLDKTKVRGC